MLYRLGIEREWAAGPASNAESETLQAVHKCLSISSDGFQADMTHSSCAPRSRHRGSRTETFRQPRSQSLMGPRRQMSHCDCNRAVLGLAGF